MMRFVFSLLKIKGRYMFRTLLAHPEEVLHMQHLVYWLRVGPAPGLKFHFNPGAANCYNMHAIYQVTLVKILLRISK
jgi:hypothetical protein